MKRKKKKTFILSSQYLGIAHLFVKVPRPGNNEAEAGPLMGILPGGTENTSGPLSE